MMKALILILALGLFAADPLPPQSGYVNVLQNSSSQMYWLFYPATQADETNQTKYPIIIWLQGGPASSLWIGNHFELGRNSLVNNSGTISEVPRDYSWNTNYSMLFLDSPVGIGYSYAANMADIPFTFEDVAAQLYTVIQNIFQNSLSSFSGTDLFIFGEYYSCKHVAELARLILKNNANEPRTSLPLKGLGFSSFWIDPRNQLDLNGAWGHSLGLLNDDERKVVELAIFNAKRLLDAGDAKAARGDWGIILDAYMNGGGNINLRNFRLFGEYDFQAIALQYLNQADVQSKYGARAGTHYVDVNLTLLSGFSPDWMRSARDALLYDLEHIPCLFYTGQDTAFTPLPSQSAFLAGLPWSGQNDFNSLEYTAWNVVQNDEITVYGNYKQFKNMAYFIVNKAGNYIPMDQLNASIDMLNRWIPMARGVEISQ